MFTRIRPPATVGPFSRQAKFGTSRRQRLSAGVTKGYKHGPKGFSADTLGTAVTREAPSDGSLLNDFYTGIIPAMRQVEANHIIALAYKDLRHMGFVNPRANTPWRQSFRKYQQLGRDGAGFRSTVARLCIESLNGKSPAEPAAWRSRLHLNLAKCARINSECWRRC